MHQQPLPPAALGDVVSRRTFVASTLAAGGALSAAGLIAAEPRPAQPPAPAKITKKFKVGLVGGGGRGQFVANHFKAHPGFEIYAVADYFPETADRVGQALGVDKSRRFSTLSGYKRLIESGVDVVALEHMPRFFPEQAAAAIAAGKHVYMAKPVAVDVPGTLAIGALGQEATRKNLCFLVDFQAPTDPANIEVRQRILDGGLGKLAYLDTYGICSRWPEPKPSTPREEYLRNSLWLHHVELAADACVSFDIHAIDTAIWVIGRRPTVASGFSRTCRANAFLSGRDVVQAVVQFDDGLIWTHQHQSLPNQCLLTNEGGLVCKVHGTEASAVLTYWGKAYIRGGKKHFVGSVDNLYDAGVVRNVARLYQNLTEGHFENPTVARSVDSHLAAILIREASYRQTRLTMDELLKENKKLDFDLTGFKV
jgi:predicted dehydrogenase